VFAYFKCFLLFKITIQIFHFRNNISTISNLKKSIAFLHSNTRNIIVLSLETFPIHIWNFDIWQKWHTKTAFKSGCVNLHSYKQCIKETVVPKSSEHMVVSHFLSFANWIAYLICMSLPHWGQHLFIFLLVVYIYSSVKVLSYPFSLGSFFLFLLICERSLCILIISPSLCVYQYLLWTVSFNFL
jgi:hypothetical protein